MKWNHSQLQFGEASTTIGRQAPQGGREGKGRASGAGGARLDPRETRWKPLDA